MLMNVRCLVLSDIHGNWPALEAVLRHAPPHDQVLFLGDAVGYYPDGGLVVDWLKSVNATCIRGNHDNWVLQPQLLKRGNPVHDILDWQQQRLDPAQLEYIQSWPVQRRAAGALLVHGSPCDPVVYMDELEAARKGFDCTSERWTFFGHTHLAGAFLALSGPNGNWVRQQRQAAHSELILAPKARALVNPGSVGQPRDGQPTAAYALWIPAEQTVEFYRVTFDLERLRLRMVEAQFPLWLYERLKYGK